jgi:flagellar basal body-associated protein FliL
MDNNIVNPQVPVQVIPPLPQMPVQKSNTGRNLIVVISAILIVIILIGTGYILFSSNSKKSTYTAQVYTQPTTAVTPSVTPTPSVYQINTKDTSDNAIDQDAQAANQNLNSLDTDLNNVDQSFNDQQTNLQ